MIVEKKRAERRELVKVKASFGCSFLIRNEQPKEALTLTSSLLSALFFSTIILLAVSFVTLKFFYTNYKGDTNSD